MTNDYHSFSREHYRRTVKVTAPSGSLLIRFQASIFDIHETSVSFMASSSSPLLNSPHFSAAPPEKINRCLLSVSAAAAAAVPVLTSHVYCRDVCESV